MRSIWQIRKVPARTARLPRRWLNVIYIDVNAVEDFHLSEEAQAWWQLPTTQQTLQQARDADWVDYSTVTALKNDSITNGVERFRAT